MRLIKGSENVRIIVLDEPGEGGACHEYVIQTSGVGGWLEVAKIQFQNGPLKEAEVNGCQQEDLLAVVIDRLQSFQGGPFPCRENAIALTKCEEALHWLEHRTKDRVERDVEGESVA